MLEKIGEWFQKAGTYLVEMFDKLKDFILSIAVTGVIFLGNAGNVLSADLPASKYGIKGTDGGVGAIAKKINENLGGVANLIFFICFLVGIFFTGTGLMRLKAASDSNGQIKYSEGTWRLMVGIALIALGTVIGIGLGTFGGKDTTSGFGLGA